jgi:YaiO family outer membrane protein
MLKLSLIILLGLNLFLISYSQEIVLDPDKLYSDARDLAQKKHYPEAREKALLVLKRSPNYHDAQILIARTYAWENKFDSARIELNKAYLIAPEYRDALLAGIDIEYWSGNFDKALKLCDNALIKYPGDKDFLLKKAQILLAMGKEQEAQEILASVLEQNPYNYQVNFLLSKLKKYRKRLIAEHTLDYYSNPQKYLWQCYSLQFQKDEKWGTWVGKFNLGNLQVNNYDVTQKKYIQFEVDAYPHLSSKSYMYLNYGFSPGNFFPTHRAGAEYFRSFGSGWEGSAGGRYLNYENGLIKHTFIFTGSVGKYYNSNWFSLRPFLIFNYKEISQVYYLFYRHYLNDINNYIGCAVGYGSSPDETSNRLDQVYMWSFKSYRLRFDIQHKLGDRVILRAMLGNTIEEYLPQTYHYRFDSNIYLAWLF